MVTEKDIKVSRIYPDLKNIRECSIKIALAIGKHCYEVGILSIFDCWMHYRVENAEVGGRDLDQDWDCNPKDIRV